MEKQAVNNKTLEKIKYDLVKDRLISYENLEKAQEVANSQNVNIGVVLVNTGLISEERLLKYLESKLHLPSISLSTYTIDEKCLSCISATDARKYKMIPLFKLEDTLNVAMSDPRDLFAIEKVVEKIGCEIEPVIVSEASVLKAIDKYYGCEEIGEIHPSKAETKTDWQESLCAGDLTGENIQALIRAVLKQAYFENVHEISFEYGTNRGLTVNFRTKNEVINTGEIPTFMSAAFISKLKVLSELDPNISEISQIGKLVFKADDMQLTASVCAFPVLNSEGRNSERILMKIYKPPKPLETYNISEQKEKELTEALEIPGIILVCGSPLSGKTHFIYSLLQKYNSHGKTIMTIESVAKYKLPGIYQSELNENIGFNVDKAMRFIEFQSPDIIYFENITTKNELDYFSSLVFKDKVLLTEFLADSTQELFEKLAHPDFASFKSVISCLVFIREQDNIEIFSGEDLKKYVI